MQAGSKAVILDDQEEREVTDEEVIEYAEFLGIDPDKEPHLMWIARKGVSAPVPHPWKVCTENNEDVFYFNFETGESVWDHPSDEKYRKMAEDARLGKLVERPEQMELGNSCQSPSSLMSPPLPGMDSDLHGGSGKDEDFDDANDFDRSDEFADDVVKAEELERCQELQQARNAQGNVGTEVIRHEVSEDESISEGSMENQSQHENSFSRSKKSSRSGRSSRSSSSSNASSASRKGSHSVKSERDPMDNSRASLSGAAGAAEEPLNCSNGSLSVSGAAELVDGAVHEQVATSKGSLSLSGLGSLSGLADRDTPAPALAATETLSEHSKSSLSGLGVHDRNGAALGTAEDPSEHSKGSLSGVGTGTVDDGKDDKLEGSRSRSSLAAHVAEDPQVASQGSLSGAAAANASENDEEPFEEEPIESSIASLPDSVGAPDFPDDTLQATSKRLPDAQSEQDTAGVGMGHQDNQGLLEAAGADVIVDLAAADASPERTESRGHAMDDEEDVAEDSLGAVSVARDKVEVLERWASLCEAVLELAPDSDEEFIAPKAQAAASVPAAEAETPMRGVATHGAGSRMREVEALPDADEEGFDPVSAEVVPAVTEKPHRPAAELVSPDTNEHGQLPAAELARAGNDRLGSSYSSEIAEEETAAILSTATKPAAMVDNIVTVPGGGAVGASTAVRWTRVRADIESLSRCLTMLRDVREKQSKYLRLLQGCN